MGDNIIMFDSLDAAKRSTIEGWVSRDGFFYGENERAARYAGCTHRPCESCGNPTPKEYCICDSCDNKKKYQRWLKKEEKAWDGKSMLYSEPLNKWFEDIDQIDNYISEDMDDLVEDSDYENLLFVIGEPVFASSVDPYDIYIDDIPEDSDLPDEIIEAFEKLNRKIVACKKPLCWMPGKFRPTLESIKIK